jgi:hypothetical protein
LAAHKSRWCPLVNTERHLADHRSRSPCTLQRFREPVCLVGWRDRASLSRATQEPLCFEHPDGTRASAVGRMNPKTIPLFDRKRDHPPVPTWRPPKPCAQTQSRMPLAAPAKPARSVLDGAEHSATLLPRDAITKTSPAVTAPPENCLIIGSLKNPRRPPRDDGSPVSASRSGIGRSATRARRVERAYWVDQSAGGVAPAPRRARQAGAATAGEAGSGSELRNDGPLILVMTQ